MSREDSDSSDSPEVFPYPVLGFDEIFGILMDQVDCYEPHKKNSHVIPPEEILQHDPRAETSVIEEYDAMSSMLNKKKRKLELLSYKISESQEAILKKIYSEISSGKTEWIGAVLEEMLFYTDSCDSEISELCIDTLFPPETKRFGKRTENDKNMTIFLFLARMCKIFKRPRRNMEYDEKLLIMHSFMVSSDYSDEILKNEFVRETVDMLPRTSYLEYNKGISLFIEKYGICPYWAVVMPEDDEQIEIFEKYIVPKFSFYNSHSMRIVEYWYQTIVKEDLFKTRMCVSKKMILCGMDKKRIIGNMKEKCDTVSPEVIEQELGHFSKSNIYLIWGKEQRRLNIWTFLIHARFGDTRCFFHCDLLPPEIFEMIMEVAGCSRRRNRKNKFLIETPSVAHAEKQ